MPSTASDEVIALVAKAPGKTALFCDFDGTIAEIVPDPESARPIPQAVKALSLISQSLFLVAVVSGRPASFLGAQFDQSSSSRIALVGLHGLERFTSGKSEPVEAARPYAAAIAQATSEARRAALGQVVVEDKTYGLTLHWRNASSPVEAAEAGNVLAARLVERYGLSSRAGKASVELLPPVGIDKGSVVRELSTGAGLVLFVGDDTSDLMAFDALDEISEEERDVVRVAVMSPEAPEELARRADLLLDGPAEAAELLSGLAAAVSN